MSEYCHINPYPDTPENYKMFIKDNKITNEAMANILEVRNKFKDILLNMNNNFKPNQDPSVYTGYGGLVYYYFSEYQKTKDKDFLTRALQLIDIGYKNINTRYISFLLGEAGILALGAVLYKFKGGQGHSDRFVDRLCHLNCEILSEPDEVLYGRAGYLYSLLFVQKYCGPVVKERFFRKVIDAIFCSGFKQANFSEKKEMKEPLHFTWHGENYYGAAHGVAGILYLLLCANDFLSDSERTEKIKPTLDSLRSKRFPSGNYFSSEKSNRDRLVQWCHGAPGFVYLFLKAWKVYKDESYLQDALDIGEIVWKRGLLTKGYSICHGVAGNAYTFIALYKATKDVKHLYRAACFADWVTHYPRDEAVKPDRKYSLFEGISGLAFFLSDMQDPMNALFPAFEI